MAKVVCVWELGENLGHLSNLKAVAERALAKGHQVWIIAKDLSRSDVVFHGLPVRLLQAPHKLKSSTTNIEGMQCYSQLIRRYCYDTREELQAYLAAWRSLFDLIKPDLVFFDHSPLALAASWGRDYKKIVMGSGFTLPPTETPLFGVFPTLKKEESALQKVRSAELQLLNDLTLCLQNYSSDSIKQVADIYRQADLVLRLTIPELDHFGRRPKGEYIGIWPSHGTYVPTWQGAGRFKVFAYLQPFTGLPKLLSEFFRQGAEVIVYCPGLKRDDREKLAHSQLQFIDTPANLDILASQIDIAVTHANHDTSVLLTLRGVPLLTIPRHQEQLFFALAHARHKLGVMAYQDQQSYSEPIRHLLSNHGYRERSLALGKKYRLQGLAGTRVDEILADLESPRQNLC